jgi:hypothetical protein
MSDHESIAEQEGIVDQQDAVLEQMEQGEGVPTEPAEQNAAERAGIVDQQDAALEAMEGEDDRTA